MARWGVIFDAGSSGTRVYIYKWKNSKKAAEDASSQELASLPQLKLKKSQKIHPGVSTFADRPSDIGTSHLQSLVDVALDEIPAHKVAETPVFVYATAGMRLLPQQQQQAILDQICGYLTQETAFLVPDCDSHVRVIPGETEGLYGWLAANYLLGGFNKAEHHQDDKTDVHHTYGFLDMGGASAQIAFAPNATETEKHADDLKLVRLRNLDGSLQEYKVFATTFLGFGVNTARHRYVEKLEQQYRGGTEDALPDPCMPLGLRTRPDGEVVPSGEMTSPEDGPVLVGTGQFPKCLNETYPLLGKEAACEESPCLLNGQHVPAIDFHINHFVGVSEFWHTTHDIFTTTSNDRAYDLASYQTAVGEFCSQEWDEISANIVGSKKKGPAEKAKNAQEACFKAAWLINILYDGIGVPRIGLDASPPPPPRLNISDTVAGKVQKQGFADPFQPLSKIDGIEITWTLGKMLLYAAGQIPPTASEALPVGFGSNVVDGIPSDFEYSGSAFDASSPNTDDDEAESWEGAADDAMGRARSKAPAAMFGLVVLAAVAAVCYCLVRRRRRLRIGGRFGRASRRRRLGSKGRGFPLMSMLFGRNPATYERVLEEGRTDEFELGGAESDESDTSDLSRAAKPSRLASLSLAAERDEEGRLDPLMDRNGLVLRTESRERLAPSNIQMLNAGRRSRAGSPARLKSPLIKPLRGD